MADQKITDLAELTAPAATDLLAIVDDPSGSPQTKKIALSNLPLLTTAKARAYRGISAQTITSGSWQKVQLNAESYDVGENFDPTTNHRFTAPVAGYYQVNGRVRMDDVGASKLLVVGIYLNGAIVASGVETHTVATGTEGSNVSDIIYMTAGQYIELWVYHDAGVDKTVPLNSAATYMSVHLISV